MSNKDQREGWLRDLKKDSDVIICTDTSEYVRSVKRITPTGQIITIGVDRFNEDKFDPQGNSMGAKHNPRHLEQATQERITRINAGNFSRID